MIKIEFAHVEGSNVFIVGALAHNASVHLAASLEIDGKVFDLAGNIRRFPRRDPAERDDLSQGFLIAKPLAEEAGASSLPGREVLLTFSGPAGTSLQFRLRLREEPTAFRQMILVYDRVLRTLLEQASRHEAYLLETAIWPHAAEREEVVELADLSPSVLLDIDFCSVPMPGVLVVAGLLLDPLGEITAIDVFHGEEDLPFDRRLIRFERSLPGTAGRDLRLASGILIILEFKEAEVPHDDFVLLLASQTRVWTRSLRPRARIDRGLDVLSAHLAAYDADTRLLILEGLTPLAAARGDGATSLRLHAMLVAAVDDLPLHLARPAIGLRLNVDLAATINGHGVFLLGWACLEPDLVRAVELRVPGPAGGASSDISGTWVLHQRMDVWRALKDEGELIHTDMLGYICVARTPSVAIPNIAYFVAHLVDDSVQRMRLKLQFTALDPLDAIKPLLTAFPQTHARLRELLDHHIGPAVTALWAQRRVYAGLTENKHYGAMPEAPECTLIIPLYGRYDFMEHQIARFADDPALRGQELIYVVDDPTIYDSVRLLAPDLHLLYDLPFRLIYSNRNMGFAAATNLGAAQARGRYLLLMNSDVLPRRFTWLADLLAAYRSLPEAGAVAPKLLYEDDSIQHAGMRFVRYPLWADMWVNEHPGKGLSDDLGNDPIECDILSGACLLIEADLYRRLGGFSEEYIIGDFEDSDLCLKLIHAGRRNWLVPSVALYHLERQSQSLVGEAEWRTNLTLLNCWTHHQRWDAIITRRVVAQ